ncbi:capping complex subunit for YIEGIA [Tissierella creatinophila]|uniref:Uncharacterized protein n=1 Tax=Tissierella creatinophila DSM 6911 TaxID=1123403 RepID=A0A1U7M3T7_TISCR|nr:hypothetical protein [Tissierella creatinophila]OLS01984.1 hypothetical protein TICRE_21260 [Tissierella creatinophila DSM 6911]
MDKSPIKQILAIVTLDEDVVVKGGVPIFFARDIDEQEKIASDLAKPLRGNIYALVNGVIIITN